MHNLEIWKAWHNVPLISDKSVAQFRHRREAWFRHQVSRRSRHGQTYEYQVGTERVTVYFFPRPIEFGFPYTCVWFNRIYINTLNYLDTLSAPSTVILLFGIIENFFIYRLFKGTKVEYRYIGWKQLWYFFYINHGCARCGGLSSDSLVQR